MITLATAADSAVARNTEETSIPASPNTLGLTPRMYAIARKVVRPAMSSVLTEVLFYFR